MSKIKEYLLDKQENGDDGTGLEYEPTVAACKNCKDNYFIEDLIWADSGAMAWLCQDCYNVKEEEDKDCTSETVWKDCDLVGHEEGCYMLVCPDCGHADRDCEYPNGR